MLPFKGRRPPQCVLIWKSRLHGQGSLGLSGTGSSVWPGQAAVQLAVPAPDLEIPLFLKEDLECPPLGNHSCTLVPGTE